MRFFVDNEDPLWPFYVWVQLNHLLLREARDWTKCGLVPCPHKYLGVAPQNNMRRVSISARHHLIPTAVIFWCDELLHFFCGGLKEVHTFVCFLMFLCDILVFSFIDVFALSNCISSNQHLKRNQLLLFHWSVFPQQTQSTAWTFGVLVFFVDCDEKPFKSQRFWYGRCFFDMFTVLPGFPHNYTLPETNSSPLKIGLPNRKLVFQPSICRGYGGLYLEGPKPYPQGGFLRSYETPQ